jgi:spermidine synthase
MGLEILAGRIVAPQFGSSIFTWGSIIGVFLAALSLGYHHGGKRAAERAAPERLARLLAGTAVFVAVVIFAGDAIVAAGGAVPLPARFASLPAVTVLFGPPTYLLGFVSPYAAELAEADGVGAASGRVYALGTVGSIVGAFGTTFLLIPELSVELVGFTLGGLLVLTAGGLTAAGADRRVLRTTALAGLLLVAAVGTGAAGLSVSGNVLYGTQTPYQELQVVERGDTRTLYLDSQRHSAMDVDEPTRHVFQYTRYFHLPYLFAEEPDRIDRVLFVGGGGFTGPKRFLAEYEDVQVDVVEIDPEVIDVAREYFAVPSSSRLNVIRDDGRRYLRSTDRQYDLIVLDAYKKDKVPFQLTTTEFMELTRDRLSENGTLVANIISAPTGPASRFYRAQYRTVNEVYPQVYAYGTAPGTAVVQNVELVATRRGERLPTALLADRNRERSIGIDLSGAIDSRLASPATDDVPVLRDDRAPVDSLLDPLVGQEYVIQRAPGGTNATDGAGANATSGPGNVTVAGDTAVGVADESVTGP